MHNLTSQQRSIAIAMNAVLYMFAQLAVIRICGSYLPALAFFKNLILLSSFLGIGIGFATAERSKERLHHFAPLLLLLVSLLWVMKHGNIYLHLGNPVSEQLIMGITSTDFQTRILTSAVLLFLFLLNAWVFMPLGAVAGYYLNQEPSQLRAYGYNLLGSLGGILLFSLLGLSWSGPAIWLLILGVFLVPFLLLGTTLPRVLCSLICMIFAAILTELPHNVGMRSFYSPYQHLVFTQSTASSDALIETNGLYFQRLFDLGTVITDINRRKIQSYYDFPYKLKQNTERVLIVGSGAGNDIAAALRNGATQVTAVEIDPVILALGRAFHPEQPYASPKVKIELNDARQVFRRSNEQFDLVIFGLLDSHEAISSKAAGLRLESYVYTVESLREAGALLNEEGLLVLSFVAMSPEFSKKIYRMITEAFVEAEVRIFQTEYDGAFTYVVGSDAAMRSIQYPLEIEEISGKIANYPAIVETSTDDWPYLYMATHVYPLSYLIVNLVTILISLLLIRRIVGSFFNSFKPAPFFLGLSFMLLETKAITELTLLYGSTFTVVSGTIFSILVMAFLANMLVARGFSASTKILYGALLASVVLSFIVSQLDFSQMPANLEIICRPMVLTIPIFFAGLCFSREVKAGGKISIILSWNLFGAMVGGALEYNSMYFGLSSLYAMVFIFYGAAFLSSGAKSA